MSHRLNTGNITKQDHEKIDTVTVAVGSDYHIEMKMIQENNLEIGLQCISRVQKFLKTGLPFCLVLNNSDDFEERGGKKLTKQD